MSILSVAPTPIPTPQPNLPTSNPAAQPGSELLGLAMLGLFTAIAIALALKFRVFRRESVIGRKRLEDHGDAGPLLIIFIFGLLIWLFVQMVYGAYKGIQLQQEGVKVTSKNMEDLLNAHDYAILSTAPFVVGFLVLLIGNLVFRPGGLTKLGLGLRQLPKGILLGIVGFLVIVPAVFWVVGVSEQLMRKVKNPPVHPLLKALGQADSVWVHRLLIIGATVCAPFFEEFLFRGHLQTLLRYFFMRISAKRKVRAAPAWMPGMMPFPGPLMSPPGMMPPAGMMPPPPGMMPPMAGSLPAPMPPPVPGPVPGGPLGPMPGPVPVQPVPWPSPVPAPFPLGYSPMFLRPQLPPLEPKAWHGWVAIFITSLLFALLHPSWSWPAIFVLAVGLGYLYERTGNLWAPIIVHLLFNSLQTIIFQLSR